MPPISTRFKRATRPVPPWLGLIFLLLVYLSPPLNAQVQKGQLHLGGQFSFATSGRNFTTSLQPDLGIMLSPKWSAGLGLPFSTNTGSTSTLGFAPFVRRYVDLKAGFYAIVHLQAGVHFNWPQSEVKTTSWNLQVIPAISYFFSPRFAFEAGFGGFNYASTQISTSGQEVKIYTSLLHFQSTPVFSLRYYFPTPTKNTR